MWKFYSRNAEGNWEFSWELPDSNVQQFLKVSREYNLPIEFSTDSFSGVYIVADQVKFVSQD